MPSGKEIAIEVKSPRARQRARRLANQELQAIYQDETKSKLGRFSRNIKYPDIISDIYVNFLTYIDENDLEQYRLKNDMKHKRKQIIQSFFLLQLKNEIF